MLEQRTWSQADLAKRVEVTPQTVKRCLEELEAAGVPLEREEDHPHVYWSVPGSWLPEGVHLPRELLVELLRRLARAATPSEHDPLLRHLLKAIPSLSDLVARVQDAHITEQTPLSAAILSELEDAYDSHAVILSYRKSRFAPVEVRFCSPMRLVDRHRQLLARCHKSDAPRRFHLHRIVQVSPAVGEDYRPLSESELNLALDGSVDGFRAPGPLVDVRFRLVGEGVGWILEDLPEDLQVEAIPSGYLVHGLTGALDKLASKLVTYGAVVRYDDEGLRAAAQRAIDAALLAIHGPPDVR